MEELKYLDADSNRRLQWFIAPAKGYRLAWRPCTNDCATDYREVCERIQRYLEHCKQEDNFTVLMSADVCGVRGIFLRLRHKLGKQGYFYRGLAREISTFLGQVPVNEVE